MERLGKIALIIVLWPAIAYGQYTVGSTGFNAVAGGSGGGQLWANILSPTYGSGACTLLASSTYAACGIDWSQAGMSGGPPSSAWTQIGPTISSGSGDRAGVVQTALNGCGTNHYVLLGVGNFQFNTGVTVPSYCELRGSGANQTIVTGYGSSGVPIALGSATAFPNAALAVNVTAGATAGSTSVTVSSAAGFSSGMLMPITELNLGPYVSNSGGPGGGNCTFCGVYNWGPLNGTTRSRGQMVQVTGVSGTVISFTPALFTDYTHTLPNWAGSTVYGYGAYITDGGHYYLQTNSNASPYTCTAGSGHPSFSTSGGTVSDGSCAWQDRGTGTTTQPQVIPVTPSATQAGVKDLQVWATNTGYSAAFGMNNCVQCWIYGTETNYLDGDIVQIGGGFHDLIFGNYFSNSYGHTPGQHDSCVNLQGFTSSTAVVNNIFERLHVSIIFEVGAAGNVAAYNYMISNFDTGSTNAVYGAMDLHAAQPQFNLMEGNVGATVTNDSTWGSNWHGTIFRNWFTGTNKVCSPTNSTRGTVTCTPSGIPGGAGVNGWQAFQGARAETFDFESLYFNSIGNVIGSSQMQSLVNTSNNPLTQTATAAWPTSRSYDGVAYGYSTGYSGASDGGSFANDSTLAASTLLIHGDYSNIAGSVSWHSGITHTLPASFFVGSKPSWWGSLAWPSIGPDVSGGTGPGGYVANVNAANPAQYCYITVMGGSDGGAGSPLTFSRTACGW